MKRPLNKYFIIATIGFIVWVAETAAFGFNAKPHSGLEAFLDVASTLLLAYGIIGDLLSNVEIHKNYYKYKETNIKTRSVSINGYSKAGEARKVSVDKSLVE